MLSIGEETYVQDALSCVGSIDVIWWYILMMEGQDAMQPPTEYILVLIDYCTTYCFP